MYVELKDDSSNRVVLSLPKGTNTAELFRDIVDSVLNERSPARVLEDLIVERSESNLEFPPPIDTQLSCTITIYARDGYVEVSMGSNQFTHYYVDDRR